MSIVTCPVHSHHILYSHSIIYILHYFANKQYMNQLICEIGVGNNIIIAGKSSRLLFIDIMMHDLQDVKDVIQNLYAATEVQLLAMDVLKNELPLQYYNQVSEVHIHSASWIHCHLFNPALLFMSEVKSMLHALTVCWNMLELHGTMTVITKGTASFVIHQRCVELLGGFEMIALPNGSHQAKKQYGPLNRQDDTLLEEKCHTLYIQLLIMYIHRTQHLLVSDVKKRKRNPHSNKDLQYANNKLQELINKSRINDF